MPSDAMMREAVEGQRSFFRRYLYPVVMAIVFLAGILAAAGLGVLLADRQVPQGRQSLGNFSGSGFYCF